MAHCAGTSCSKESKNMEDKVSQSICQSDDLFKVGKFEESYNVLKQFEVSVIHVFFPNLHLKNRRSLTLLILHVSGVCITCKISKINKFKN